MTKVIFIQTYNIQKNAILHILSLIDANENIDDKLEVFRHLTYRNIAHKFR